MEPQKTKKLILKNETISVLSDYSQSRLKGAEVCWWATFYTTPMSHMEITNCMFGYGNSEYSYCDCSDGNGGGTNSCDCPSSPPVSDCYECNDSRCVCKK